MTVLAAPRDALGPILGTLAIFAAWAAWTVGVPAAVRALPATGAAHAAPEPIPLCAQLDLEDGDLPPGSCAPFGGFGFVWTQRCLASDACFGFYMRNQGRCAARPTSCAHEYAVRGGVL
jgi:hypothetical protein